MVADVLLCGGMARLINKRWGMVERAVLGVERLEGGGTGQGYEWLMKGLGAEEFAGGTGGEG